MVRGKYTDWDAQPLGMVTDSELAKRLGVSLSAVYLARKRRGVRRFQPNAIDWDAQPLGKKADCAIARELGVASQSVRMARIKAGIAVFSGRAIRSYETDWDNWPLGQYPDRVIAEVAGCSLGAVVGARVRRNIPTYPKTEYACVVCGSLFLSYRTDRECCSRQCRTRIDSARLRSGGCEGAARIKAAVSRLTMEIKQRRGN